MPRATYHGVDCQRPSLRGWATKISYLALGNGMGDSSTFPFESDPPLKKSCLPLISELVSYLHVQQSCRPIPLDAFGANDSPTWTGPESQPEIAPVEILSMEARRHRINETSKLVCVHGYVGETIVRPREGQMSVGLGMC